MRTFFALLKFAALLIVCSFAECRCSADVDDSQQFHIVTAPVCSVTALLGYSVHWNNYTPTRVQAVVPLAQELASQSNITQTLQVVGKPNILATQCSDLSPAHIPFLYLAFDTGATSPVNDYVIQSTIKATLYSQQLTSGPPLNQVKLLDGHLKAVDISETKSFDYNDPSFQSWLTINHLRRQPGERDIFFARRVFDWIQANYTYQYVPDQVRTASSLCMAGWSDCGGLSTLLVSALRAGGVPATTIAGHLAETGNDANHNECHVKSIFYCDKIGWVPADMSYGACNKNTPDYNYFGHDDGDFIALGDSPDNTIDWGNGDIKPNGGTQQISAWIHGKGAFVAPIETFTWSVTYGNAPADATKN